MDPYHLILASTFDKAKDAADDAGYDIWAVLNSAATVTSVTANLNRRMPVLVLVPGYENHPRFAEVAQALTAMGFPNLAASHPDLTDKGAPNPDTPKPGPSTTAALYTGYYRELVAGGMPRDVAKRLVATAATQDRRLHVHKDAMAAVDATRERTLKTARADSMSRHPAGKRAPKGRSTARERRGPLVVNVQERPDRWTAQRAEQALNAAAVRGHL